MFGVNGENLRTGARERVVDQLAGNDERFLIGQCNVLIGGDGPEGREQAGVADCCSDDHVNVGRLHFAENRFVARGGFNAGAAKSGHQSRILRVVGDNDAFRTIGQCLLNQGRHTASANQHSGFKQLRIAADNIESLLAD